MLGCTIITYFCLPETKGRSPAELDIMFEAGLPARKFKGTLTLRIETASSGYYKLNPRVKAMYATFQSTPLPARRNLFLSILR